MDTFNLEAGKRRVFVHIVEALSGVLEQCEEWRAFWALLDAGEDARCGIAQSARPFVIAARFCRTPQPTLVVVASEDAADNMTRMLRTYLGENVVLRFPMEQTNPWNSTGNDPVCCAHRAQALNALYSGRDVVVVASARSLLTKFVPVETNMCVPLVFEVSKNSLYKGDELQTFDEVLYALEHMGYLNTAQLEGPGSFCYKGGSIDLFPGNNDFPIRLDFFGDELEDIRRLVPSTGQTISSLQRVEIYPVISFQPSKKAIARAKDVLYNPAKTNPVLRDLLEQIQGNVLPDSYTALFPYFYEKPAGIADYLCRESLVCLLEPRSLIDDALHAAEEYKAAAEGSSLPYVDYYFEATKLDFGNAQNALFQSIMSVGAQLDVEMPVKRSDVAGDSERLFGRLRNLVDAGYYCVLSVANVSAREEIKVELVEHSLPIIEVLSSDTAQDKSLSLGVVSVTDLDIPLGFVLPKAKLALISIADTRSNSNLGNRKHVDITQITFPFAPGDYVVHAAHGIAYFKELITQELGGVQRDYLLLEYAENDKLYVPVEQLDRVTRYVGPSGDSPRLTRLNTSDWSRAMNRARSASKKLAFDLIDVYSRRAAAKGFAFSADTIWQRQMEQDFPYAETPDQLAAIADVKADMQAARPMDRLICGDVGFGKTEVALRAVFKATQDNKQVMVLCPTTILAQQHFLTFSERFSPYSVSVEVLSRFRSAKQQQDALSRFSRGELDVLIGTHRLLSRDVNPRDLGLVVIDEEQRFGVGHKEQLKNLRESIDVLTLSATPIPRTMQMSLSGVRDMSLILTPPDDRRPVEVHVGEWDPDLVSGAIQRELDRRGQVYYVSNRVRSIDDALARVQNAVPSARVGLAHGQMSKEELEGVMEEFSAGLIDILVATTIIESGIDNPHTNTLIIEDSQRLGLAQMYQLKGRVGRSNQQAYAYFLFPEQVNLTEEALARLMALNEHQDLGSGMRVAMRDLEIRGAGTLLGAEQSGNMSAVGFDLFAQMLSTAVQEAREGKKSSEELLPESMSDITVNIAEHSYIPPDYVVDVDMRVMYYRKIASALSTQELSLVREELAAKYGPVPDATCNLLAKAEIRVKAHALGVKLVNIVGGKLNIEPLARPHGEAMTSIQSMHGRYLAASSKLSIPLKYFISEEDGSLLDAIVVFMALLESDNT